MQEDAHVYTHIHTYISLPQKISLQRHLRPDNQSQANHRCPMPSKFIPRKTPSTAVKLCRCLSSEINLQGRSRAAVSPGVAVPCSELRRAAAGSLRPGPASPAIKFPRSDGSPQSWIWMLGLSRRRWHREHLIFCWGSSRRSGTARSSPAGAGRILGGCPGVLPMSSRGPRRLIPGESYSQHRRSRRCHRDAPSAAELVSGDAFRPQTALLRQSYLTPREAAGEMGF